MPSEEMKLKLGDYACHQVKGGQGQGDRRRGVQVLYKKVAPPKATGRVSWSLWGVK